MERRSRRSMLFYYYKEDCMSRVPWSFDGYEWPINPDTDTGWVKEHIFVEQNPLQASLSFFQRTSSRSARRRISGWIYGPQGQTFKSKLEYWHAVTRRALLVDHLGVQKMAFLYSLSFTAVFSVSEWRYGRQTWRYDAEFVECA